MLRFFFSSLEIKSWQRKPEPKYWAYSKIFKHEMFSFSMWLVNFVSVTSIQVKPRNKTLKKSHTGLMESLFTPKESAICLFLSCLIPFSVKSLLFLLPTNLTVLRETRWAASSLRIPNNLRNTQRIWRGVSGETDGWNKIHNFYLLFFDLFIE